MLNFYYLCTIKPKTVKNRPNIKGNNQNMNSKIPQEWNKFYLKDVSFVNLMTRRIFNVLIVANPYDACMLEDDGRVDEKIFD